MQRLLLIFNRRTILVVILAILSTALCEYFSLYANFSVTFILSAVIFPVVFSINSAYERREKALGDYASLKSNGRSLYLAMRDWMENPNPDSLGSLRKLLEDFLYGVQKLLQDEPEHMEKNETEVYRSFSQLSKFIRSDMRMHSLAATEVSRVNNYLNAMMLAFEDIKHIYQYRTPKMLKVFGDFFVAMVPVLYGPYFAFIGLEYSSGGLEFVMPILFSIVLTSLVNIQSQLENPFDQFGEDDVVFETSKFITSLEVE